MHPSSISLTYTGIPLFKTFMNIKLIVYTLQKRKKKQTNEARVVERKSSTLKQKRNNESVKYVMENIFQILSTSSCTQIVLLYSLGSFTLLCKADCALCKHKSPSEQILCMLSHLYALMQQQHSAHCCCFFLASFFSS